MSGKFKLNQSFAESLDYLQKNRFKTGIFRVLHIARKKC